MHKIARVLFESCQKIIRLLENIHLSTTQMEIGHDERSDQITLTPVDERTKELRQRDWDNLFEMAAEIPQEEWDLFDASLRTVRTCPKCGA